MSHLGSCHCGRIKFEVHGELKSAMECNCSHCSRKGYLLWFVQRTAFTLTTDPSALGTYTFNKHVIQHHFCTNCGCSPFGLGTHDGVAMAAINIRCLEDVDLAQIPRVAVDGRSF
jgi:hypothetical protein